MELIRCDNKGSCDCSRTNGILGSSLEKNISLIEEKLGQSNKKNQSILLNALYYVFTTATIFKTRYILKDCSFNFFFAQLNP